MVDSSYWQKVPEWNNDNPFQSFEIMADESTAFQMLGISDAS